MLPKWLLFFTFILVLSLSSIDGQPTPTTTAIAKRQESDVIDYHRTEVTRTSAEVPTETSSKDDKNDKNDKDNDDSKDTEPEQHNTSKPIPAQTAPWFEAVYGQESGISTIMACLGAILIVLGLFLCSMGFRMFRPMLCVMGLLTFGSMTWIALANLRPDAGYPSEPMLMIVVPVCVGLVGAGAFYFLWSIALYLVCAFGGFIFAIFVLSWRADLVIHHPIGRPCFLGGMALLTGIVTFFSLRPMLFFATSFVGAYIFMFGVDCLSRSGLIAGPQVLLNRNPSHNIEYAMNKIVYVMLAMIIVMFLISMGWQMLFNAAHHLGMHIVAAAKGKPAHEEAKEEGDGGGRPPSTAPTS